MDIRWKPNVTVAAIIEKDGRYLLVEEQTRDGLRLNNPAGHLDPGESPAEGCAREALEETAHLFKPTALVGVYLSRYQSSRMNEDVTYLRFAFSGRVGARHDRPLDEGILRAVWMSLDELRRGRPDKPDERVLRQRVERIGLHRRQPGERWVLTAAQKKAIAASRSSTRRYTSDEGAPRSRSRRVPPPRSKKTSPGGS